MTRTFGNYIEKDDNAQDYLVIVFRPSSLPLQQRWRNNGLSADFLADYVTTFFPAESDEALHRQIEAKDAVSYVANELLENAMKFSYEPAMQPISIDLHLQQNNLRFYVCNGANPMMIEAFQGYIQEMLASDPDDMYMRQLEANATEDDGQSHLGYLTMLTSYGAEVAWKFETMQADTEYVMVTTMVQLSI